MNFFAATRIYRDPNDAISLRDVWMICDGELNTISGTAFKHLRNEEELDDLHHQVAWASQALIEFADLANFMRSAKGRFQYKNYLYFEAVIALREATVGILNGSPRASTGLLRSVMEMLMLHCWWQERISRKGSTEQFYDWLEGRRPKPMFKNVVENNFDWLGIPPEAAAKKHVKSTYERLCSYVHAPVREESVTILNRSNVGQIGEGVLRHWLTLARDVLHISLEQLVHLYPQCLLPVDIIRKFGFNPPAGMYFDEFNFVPLRAVFDEDIIELYRTRTKDRDVIECVMNFYRSQPDLTREQILETWSREDEFSSIDPKSESQVALWFLMKVKMRVLSMVLTYSEPLSPRW